MSLLADQYKELEGVDRDLRNAEWQLLWAHLDFGRKNTPRPEVVFREVLSLRERSRTLLARLGEEFVAG